MKLHGKILSFLLIVLAVGFGTSIQTAHAQQGLAVDTFKPATGPDAIFELALPKVKDHLGWTLGGLFHYAHEPMRRTVTNTQTGDVESDTYPLKLRLQLDIYAAIGLGGFAELGIAVPVILFQDGEGGVPGGEIQPAGIGDPRIDLKFKFLDVKGFTMGAGLIVTAPVGHYASSGEDLMGSKLPTIEPKVLAAYSANIVTAALNVGFLVRPGTETIGDYDQNHALTWNLGVAVDIFDFYEPGGLRLGIEANSEAGINFSNITETPIEVLLGAKYRTAQDIIIMGGAGPGTSTAVGTPSFRVFLGIAYDPRVRGCPAGPEDMDGFEDDDECIDPDNDQDGILDVDDECPNDPEDFDKFEDEDGCPELDNDKDTILDSEDACPMVPEDVDNFEDEDGCPEEGPDKPTVQVTDTQLLISSKIYFDYDKATIKEVSHPILDAVAETLNASPNIKKVRIEGHTDIEGSEEYNQVLSENRAQAVMEYLINKNVAPERLTYKGYGYTAPKASNESEEGKAINRRVEFTILEKE